MRSKMIDRNWEIYHDRTQGKTYRELAKKHSITPERVRQIVWKYNKLALAKGVDRSWLP